MTRGWALQRKSGYWGRVFETTRLDLKGPLSPGRQSEQNFGGGKLEAICQKRKE